MHSYQPMMNGESMPEDVLIFNIVDGHVAAEQQYVYCWFHPRDGKIIYVGATWLHPAARFELHMNGLDPEARVVGGHLEQAEIAPNEPMRVLAFPIAKDLDRQEARHALIALLSQAQLLSDTYFGPAPATADRIFDAVISARTQEIFLTIESHRPG